MDRRKRKTRAAIQAACVALVQEKGFEAMSISDITERADINRGTFYLHFIDKYDMIDQFEAELMHDIEENLLNGLIFDHSIEALIRSRYHPLVHIFTIFRDKRDIVHLLFQAKGVFAVQEQFERVVLQIFQHQPELTQIHFIRQVPPLFFTVVVSALIGIAQYWIRGDGTQTPEELAEDLLMMIINGPARATGFLPLDVIDVRRIIRETP